MANNGEKSGQDRIIYQDEKVTIRDTTSDEFKAYVGCQVDVVLYNENAVAGEKYVYLECVWSGNIKAHTFNNGIFQTGEPYPKSSVAKTEPFSIDYVNGSIVEFTGFQPSSKNGKMSNYIVKELILYPK